MQQFEFTQDVELNNEECPLIGNFAQGSIVEADPSHPSIVTLIEQGIIKLYNAIVDEITGGQSEEEGEKTEETTTEEETVETPVEAPSDEEQTTQEETQVEEKPPVEEETNANAAILNKPEENSPAAKVHEVIKSQFPIPPEPFQDMHPMLYAFCKAIESVEVYCAPGENPHYPAGTRSFFDKNPGNLKFRNQIDSIDSDKDGFAMFPSYETGFMALARQVELVASGKSKNFPNPVWDPILKSWRPMNFKDFFVIYDASHANDPLWYAGQISEKMSVPVETTINQLVS